MRKPCFVWWDDIGERWMVNLCHPRYAYHEVVNWCHENIKGWYTTSRYFLDLDYVIQVAIQDEKDAILFKLRWE